MTQAAQEPDLPPFGGVLDPRACVLRHVARASRAVVAAFDPAFAPLGLTGHQYNLMTTLNNMKELSVGTLASMLGMDPSGVPRAIRPLVDQNLIQVERGSDRRQRVLSLTDEGRDRLIAATKVWTGVQSELMDTIGSDRWLNLISELRDVRNAAANCSTRSPNGETTASS